MVLILFYIPNKTLLSHTFSDLWDNRPNVNLAQAFARLQDQVFIIMRTFLYRENNLCNEKTSIKFSLLPTKSVLLSYYI
jgi:hypothetical protein